MKNTVQSRTRPALLRLLAVLLATAALFAATSAGVNAQMWFGPPVRPGGFPSMTMYNPWTGTTHSYFDGGRWLFGLPPVTHQDPFGNTYTTYSAKKNQSQGGSNFLTEPSGGGAPGNNHAQQRRYRRAQRGIHR